MNVKNMIRLFDISSILCGLLGFLLLDEAGAQGVLEAGTCYTPRGEYYKVDAGTEQIIWSPDASLEDMVDKCAIDDGFPAMINTIEAHLAILQCWPAAQRTSPLYNGLVNLWGTDNINYLDWIQSNVYAGIPFTEGYTDHLETMVDSSKSCTVYPPGSNMMVEADCVPPENSHLLCSRYAGRNTTIPPGSPGPVEPNTTLSPQSTDPVEKPTPDPTIGEGCNCSCPDHWLREGDTCYMMSTEPVGWKEANAKCHYMGGMLFNPSMANGEEVAMKYGKRAPEWMWISLISKAHVHWTNGKEVTVERGEEVDLRQALFEYIHANERSIKDELEELLDSLKGYEVEELLDKLISIVESFDYMNTQGEDTMKDMEEKQFKMLCHLEILIEKILQMFWNLDEFTRMCLEVIKCSVVILKRIKDHYMQMKIMPDMQMDLKDTLMNLISALKERLNNMIRSSPAPEDTDSLPNAMQVLKDIKEKEIDELILFYYDLVGMDAGNMMTKPGPTSSVQPYEYEGKPKPMHFVYPPSICMQCGVFATEMCMSTGEQSMLHAMMDCMQPRPYMCQMMCIHIKKPEQPSTTVAS